MPGMTADVGASHTTPMTPAPIEQQPEVAGPSSSKLTGRAELGTNPAPRAGVLTRIANFGRNLLARIFPSRQPSAPRVDDFEHREIIFS
jgi:hypothetical protein